jgi:hypothetical protein
MASGENAAERSIKRIYSSRKSVKRKQKNESDHG